MTTIEPELTEYQYFVLTQAVAAAGTASNRHGMHRHAEAYHEAEKALFRAYEQAGDSDDVEYRVLAFRDNFELGSYDATSVSIASLVEELTESTDMVLVERK